MEALLNTSYKQDDERLQKVQLPPAHLLPDFAFDLPALHYPELLNTTTELLENTVADGYGWRRAIVHASGEWTYAELNSRVSRLASALKARGVRHGTRVLLRGPNAPFLVASWFAVLKLGAIAVTVLPSLRRRELSEIIRKAQVTHAICDAAFAEDLMETNSDAALVAQVLQYDGDGPIGIDLESTPELADLVVTRAEDIALIAFSSGSTGEPKACLHLHRDILAIADTFSAHILRPTPEDLFCGTPPFGFTFGLGGLIVFPFRARAATLLVETPGIKALAEAIERFRPTICFSAPTGYRGLARLVAEHDLSSLRKAVSAGDWLPNETRNLFEAATGIELIDGIGSTELLHIFISASGNEIRPGATGKVVPGYQATILDDSGNELPPGTAGRLAVKGPTGCRYLDDPRQQAYVQDGWNITGDIYLRDEERYYWFVARSDDMIVSAGCNIAGPEIERVLLTHPAVAECIVTGVPDPERGQIVKAWVVVQPDWTEKDQLETVLTAYVTRLIASYKRPRQFAFIDALPRTDTGKLQRFRLR